MKMKSIEDIKEIEKRVIKELSGEIKINEIMMEIVKETVEDVLKDPKTIHLINFIESTNLFTKFSDDIDKYSKDTIVDLCVKKSKFLLKIFSAVSTDIQRKWELL